MNSYLSFIAANRRFLSFGVTAAFLSSFGQTFFIALFGGAWRAEFGLSHGDFGTLYSLGTLCAGLTLIWLGRKIDHVDLTRYTLMVSGGLAAACLLTAVVPSAIFLCLVFYLLRLTGQGLMSHVSIIAMARYFDRARGKAVSLAALGHPLGEAIFPPLAVLLLGLVGWRWAWGGFGIVLLVGVAPLMLWLLRGQAERETARQAGLADALQSGVRPVRSRTLSEVVRDPVFYPQVLAMMAPAFISTGLFFHQVHLAEVKGWSLEWLASCFVGFAVAQALSSLVAGTLVDRLGGIRLLPFYLPALGLAALTLIVTDHVLGALVYMILVGTTAGAGFTLMGAVFAEMHGTGHLGAIRSLIQATMVMATAASPIIFGLLLDAGVGFDMLAGGCVAYVAAGAVTLALLQPTLRARRDALTR